MNVRRRVYTFIVGKKWQKQQFAVVNHSFDFFLSGWRVGGLETQRSTAICFSHLAQRFSPLTHWLYWIRFDSVYIKVNCSALEQYFSRKKFFLCVSMRKIVIYTLFTVCCSRKNPTRFSFGGKLSSTWKP